MTCFHKLTDREIDIPLLANRIICEAFNRADWCAELEDGKMMGLLIVSRCDGNGVVEKGYLKAYSGQICGRSDWEGYVPAIFDYLQEDGYFKKEEAKISKINDEIDEIECGETFINLKNQLSLLVEERSAEIEEMKIAIQKSKVERDHRRLLCPNDDTLAAQCVMESQFQNAELRRMKKSFHSERQTLETAIDDYRHRIEQMKSQRHRMSDELQRWLFEHFIVRNHCGEERSVNAIFVDSTGQLPPSGTGECCAPKLLDYAFRHDMRPIELAEFWVGRSPSGKMRRQGYFYEPCRAKCQPLLRWMWGDEISIFGHEKRAFETDITTLYEDDYLIAVNKPAGMLSVRGLEADKSLEELLQSKLLSNSFLRLVHRLDMDTSGVVVAAKSMEVYKKMQQMFASREVKKEYEAIVEGIIPDEMGEISLPLRADIDDRPRQIVDYNHGSKALTRYERVEEMPSATRIRLYPLTGRTHQLRVHCAHFDGLNAPIRGDRLYGTDCDRLYLHARKIEFLHPITGENTEIRCETPF